MGVLTIYMNLYESPYRQYALGAIGVLGELSGRVLDFR